jgi:putative hydrolase of HD superfamily
MRQIVDFILEVDRLKAVTRKVRPAGLDRYENSAEHSWQIALFAASLVPHADGPLDLDRVIRMLLVHDLGEIDTGDTIVFAREGWPERKSAERAAVERIFGMLPKSTGEAFLTLWEEFEVAETGEARFAHAVDRAMPVLLNLNNEGGSWKEHRISYSRVVERVGPEIEAGCPALWRYIDSRLVEAREKQWFGEEVPAAGERL